MPRARLALAVLLAGVATSALAQTGEGDWPSYNRSLTGERFSPLKDITPANAGRLHQICAYDLGRQTGFETGPIVVGGTMYLTTEFDTVAIDPATCAEKWRATEHYQPVGPTITNRGVAYADGRLFRGTEDARVLAYDAATGKRLWEHTIGDTKHGESVPAAPIAWEGLVFIGNAGGDNKDGKGHMYALDAATGEVRWEFYLVPKGADETARGPVAPLPQDLAQKVAGSWGNAPGIPVSGGGTWTSFALDPANGLLYVPAGNPGPDFTPNVRPGQNLFANSIVVLDARTGAYRGYMPMALHDFHDWDVSASPALFTSRAGGKLVATAGKDGYLYTNDRDSGQQLRRQPITRIENATAPLTPEGTRFCPGTQGGTEWNGPAYSSATNMIYTGAVDWCATVSTGPASELRSAATGQPWTGAADMKTEAFGKFDPPGQWAGWVYAHDADSGETRWQHKMEAPVLGGVTATAGGLVFVGDMAGDLAALDAGSGQQAWSARTGGAIGGGIVSYAADGKQRIAVASGMVSPIWPAPHVNARIIVYGVE